jgi:hypothetical protein
VPPVRVSVRVKGHRVTITAATDRARAVCECSWASPWATAGPPQSDIPPRPDYRDRVIRAAAWHITQQARLQR